MRYSATSCGCKRHRRDIKLSTIWRVWPKILIYYPTNLQGNLGLNRTWKRNDTFYPRNLGTGQQNSGVRYYFLMNRVSSHFLHVLEVFVAQWERGMGKGAQVQTWNSFLAQCYRMQCLCLIFLIFCCIKSLRL